MQHKRDSNTCPFVIVIHIDGCVVWSALHTPPFDLHLPPIYLIASELQNERRRTRLRNEGISHNSVHAKRRVVEDKAEESRIGFCSVSNLVAKARDFGLDEAALHRSAVGNLNN